MNGKLLIGGKWLDGSDRYEVRSPWNGDVVGTMASGGEAELESAIAAADTAFAKTSSLNGYERMEILDRVRTGIQNRAEELSRLLALEAGKPVKAARAEVQRSLHTFDSAREESTRMGGEVLPLDARPWGEGRTGFLVREPIGPIAAITPFNFPVNLVAHKLSPAMAVGNSIVLRPATQTPLTSFVLSEIITDAGYPAGGLNLISCPSHLAAPLATDSRLKLLSFTGSPLVGWSLKQKAYRKRVALELGGNAGTIVHHDADLEYAAQAVTNAAFSYAGQSCISVQRVFVHKQIFNEFQHKLEKRIKGLNVGDPLDEQTDVGPMINVGEAERAESWIAQAVEQGATVLTGGRRDGALLEPTVLLNTTDTMRVNCEERFAPVLTLTPYSDFERVVRTVDDSDFGLQAGIFTRDIARIHYAIGHIKAGGIIIGDVPTWRIDHMPYGGVKNSGNTKEGVHWSMREMTEEKFIAIRW